MRIVGYAESDGKVPYRPVPHADRRIFHIFARASSVTWHRLWAFTIWSLFSNASSRQGGADYAWSVRQTFHYSLCSYKWESKMALSAPPRLPTSMENITIEYKALTVAWLPFRMAMLRLRIIPQSTTGFHYHKYFRLEYMSASWENDRLNYAACIRENSLTDSLIRREHVAEPPPCLVGKSTSRFLVKFSLRVV